MPDEKGNLRYIVQLNPEIVAGYSARGEPQALGPRDPRSPDDFRSWHRPNVRAVIKQIEAEYGIAAVSMTSWVLPTFAAHISEPLATKLRSDRRVVAIELSYRALDHSAWLDANEGSETVPWGKIAIGTHDERGTGNVIYVLDGDMRPHPELDFVTGKVNENLATLPEHATHVGGIVSARRNGVGTQGINPSNIGGKVVAVKKGEDDNAIIQAFDWVFYDAETSGRYPVANLSANRAERYRPNTITGAYLRHLSNRVLVVQSAGNQGTDACGFAWGPANPVDGILVVGGIDQNGAYAYPYDNSGAPPFGIEPGSNYGLCVEAWAPSMNVFSTWTFDRYQRLSGTSMAAPHVAALAARYGSDFLSLPVERESFIRSRLSQTGFNDPQGIPIAVPSASGGATSQPASRLRIASISADATAPGSSTDHINDGLYLNGVWNAGHGPPAWIELDLGRIRNISSIRMSPEVSPGGLVRHRIYVGNSPSPPSLVYTAQEQSQILEPIVAQLNAAGRYVRILTDLGSSWVAWREVEVYGQRTSDEMAIEWFYAGFLARSGDGAGYGYWLSDLRSAGCGNAQGVLAKLDAISAAFVYSSEFLGRGLTNEQYVTALYEGLLKRFPEASGLAYWTGQLNSSAITREALRATFVQSSEFYMSTVAPVSNDICS